MARQANPRPAPRVPLSRERVLRAAIALADEGGIKALSMRRLAQELGVEAMSLYNHVANKDDILEGIIDLVAGEIDWALEGTDWKAATRRRALSAHEVLLRHRWAAGIWMSTGGTGTARLRYADAILRGFREAGFPEDLTYHAFHVLQSHIIGFTLYVTGFQFDAEQLKDMAATFLRDFPGDDYPDLALHIRQHMEPSEAHGGTFEFGLDLILDGLERLRDTA
jgi:AcrR family transcriptional regulator